ncbi:protein translocase SEC61 complex subunit gamma [Candidatus Bathyarchaeota archaeon]|nr:MAG: protein translocase SEC61 complex subunit gamma [Candidatus Bathyarchaeota archaeon]
MLSERTTLGLKSFLKSSARLLKLAKKPGRTELWLSVKICFLGILAIGAIAFLIKFISTSLTL